MILCLWQTYCCLLAIQLSTCDNKRLSAITCLSCLLSRKGCFQAAIERIQLTILEYIVFKCHIRIYFVFLQDLLMLDDCQLYLIAYGSKCLLINFGKWYVLKWLKVWWHFSHRSAIRLSYFWQWLWNHHASIMKFSNISLKGVFRQNILVKGLTI